MNELLSTSASTTRTGVAPTFAADGRSPTFGRTEVELTDLQLQAIAAFNRARRMAEQAAETRVASREMRMDLDRRLEVLRAQHAAVVARTEEHLRRSVAVMRRTAPRRAVVAHRNAWFVEKVCGDLAERGIEIAGRFENGAEAVGVAVAEQPDLVLVEDRLAMQSGLDVVREVRHFVPDCLIAAQVAYSDRVQPMIEAGATCAYTRQVPPLDVSADLARLIELARDPA